MTGTPTPLSHREAIAATAAAQGMTGVARKVAAAGYLKSLDATGLGPFDPFADGPRVDFPKRGAGRWCDCFEVKEGRITRLCICLDPDHAGKDTARYGWIPA